MRIREPRPDDLPRLLDIYNHYVSHTHITFDIEPLSIEVRRKWFETFASDGPHRLFVVELNGETAGYASSREFRPKAAYARSVETSIYLAEKACGSGTGGDLYTHLLDALAKDVGVHRAYAGVTLPNEASISLHQRLGFKRVATFSEVGFKFGRYWDVAWYERPL
jgi:phosphinothricin acetyltransferase